MNMLCIGIRCGVKIAIALALLAIPVFGWSKSLTLSPGNVTGGAAITGTVTLAAAAGSGGLAVTLSSDQACIKVPSSVTVPKGATTVTFTATTTPVPSTAFVTLKADADRTAAVAMATVVEPAPSQLTVSQSPVYGGTSLSAAVKLTGNAPTGGLTIYFANTDPSIQPPASLTIAAGTSASSFTISTNPVYANVISTVYAYTDAGETSGTATVLAPTPKSITFSSSSVIGGNSLSGIVTLNGPVPMGGLNVALKSSNAAMQVPNSVAVSSGSSATFSATTVPVTANTNCTVTATADGGSETTTVTVLAPTIAVVLYSSQVYGGQSVQAYVASSSPAPSGGFTVALSSDSAIASTPASVSIPAGAEDGYFTVSTVLGKTGTAHIIGKLNGSTASAALTLVATGLALSPWPKFHAGSLNDGLSSGKGATGNLRWSVTAPNAFYSSPVIGADGTVYAGNFTSVYAWNGSTGQQKWRFSPNDSFNAAGVVGANGLLYIGGLGGNVYALNAATGASKWTYATAGEIVSAPTIGPDGTVYIGSEDAYVYAITGSGSLNWRQKTGGIVYTSPAIGADGTIYFGSTDNVMYAIK
jgi:outer membrane protein assembly factor BamB